MSDSAYAKNGSLPPWYMTLRGYLTSISVLCMLTTAAWFLSRDFERAKQRMLEDDAKRAALLRPPPPPSVAVEAPAPPAKKKGWW
jgi:hypothetical protein